MKIAQEAVPPPPLTPSKSKKTKYSIFNDEYYATSLLGEGTTSRVY